MDTYGNGVHVNWSLYNCKKEEILNKTSVFCKVEDGELAFLGLQQVLYKTLRESRQT